VTGPLCGTTAAAISCPPSPVKTLNITFTLEKKELLFEMQKIFCMSMVDAQ